jgi:hypothetical protein
MTKDPAFLFYDGDAARDVSHMNRLERGAYFDIIQAQRKFGGITVEQARKILGKDFDEVWPAIELILIKSEDKFFIEWVKDSIENRKDHAEKQRKRIQDYWDNKKKEEEKVNPNIPRNNDGITTVIPLVNENAIANENEKVNEEKGVIGGKKKPEPKEEIIYPWVSDEFMKWWTMWKKYRKEEHKFNYKSAISEQATLKLLNNMAGGIEKKAIEIIEYTIAKSWKGFVIPDNTKNRSPTISDDFKTQIFNDAINSKPL